MRIEDAANKVHERTSAMLRGLLDADELPDGMVVVPGSAAEQRMLLLGLELDDPDEMMSRLEGATHRLIHMVAFADSLPTTVNTVRLVLLQQVLFGYLLGEAAGHEDTT